MNMSKLSVLFVAAGIACAGFGEEQKAAPAEKKPAIVFVSAHPDDSEGFAATAFLLRDKYELHIVDVTRGCEPEDKKIRTEEETQACAYLGAKLYFLDERDRFVYASPASVRKLRNILEEVKPVAIFAHWPIDKHCDHVQASALARRAWKEAQGFKSEHYFFEVLESQTLQFQPLYSVDVSKTIGQKAEMLRKYVSQNPRDGLATVKVRQAQKRGGQRVPRCAAAEIFTTYDGKRIENGVLEQLAETVVIGDKTAEKK